ncbi:cytochrome c oxidase assembly protein [Halomonas sp. CS7]|uniref:Cytochrome c oxidase assembly protein CtaG n=1 Tax=Halomonas pelophila TaxID=3151122 RepID=A0ABV1N5R6_9GAMM
MSSRDEQSAGREGVRRTVTRTLVVLGGMFVFAFALVPLYDVFCDLTGLNGKTSARAQPLVEQEVDASRTVTVQFITRGSQGLPWHLEVDTRQIRLHPGQREEVYFTFRNNGDATTRARAVPSVSPSAASLHLRKLTCFCFQEQQLAAGERLEAPLVFQLTRDLPPDIKTVTLVYTLYPVQSTQAEVARLESITEGDSA